MIIKYRINGEEKILTGMECTAFLKEYGTFFQARTFYWFPKEMEYIYFEEIPLVSYVTEFIGFSNTTVEVNNLLDANQKKIEFSHFKTIEVNSALEAEKGAFIFSRCTNVNIKMAEQKKQMEYYFYETKNIKVTGNGVGKKLIFGSPSAKEEKVESLECNHVKNLKIKANIETNIENLKLSHSNVYVDSENIQFTNAFFYNSIYSQNTTFIKQDQTFECFKYSKINAPALMAINGIIKRAPQKTLIKQNRQNEIIINEREDTLAKLKLCSVLKGLMEKKNQKINEYLEKEKSANQKLAEDYLRIKRKLEKQLEQMNKADQIQLERSKKFFENKSIRDL